MPKPLADLPDGDTRTDGAAGLDQQDREAATFVRHLEDLLADHTLAWAEDTLTGIRDSVEQTGRVTSGQREAVANIRKHQGDDTRRKPSRRYEGWQGSD